MISQQKQKGLTEQQAASLLEKLGPNELEDQARASKLQMIASQFNNILIYLLIAAAIISFVIGEGIESLFIVLIIVVNALLGFIQEYKADNAIHSLKSMTVSKVRVIREGFEKLVDSVDLVPGDIVKLEQGDKVPADGVLIEARRLEVNEASLTGESLPVAKKVNDSDLDKVYLGTIISSGSGVVRLSETGPRTKIGSMAVSLSNIEAEETPLMKKINTLGKQLSLLAVMITVVIFFIGLSQQRDLLKMVQISISLAVAAVPEGLPAVITITLAVGLQKMANQRAILRKLGSIEGLGNTTVIATDKTGTLTQNKMKVFKTWVNDSKLSVSQVIKHKNNKAISLLLRTGIFCNNAALVANEAPGGFSIIGDQTEGSLLLLAKDVGMSIEEIKKGSTLVDEYMFDQKKKLMSMVTQTDESLTLFTKGAPESVLSLSTHILIDGKKQILTQPRRDKLQRKFDEFASEGLRILALSYRPLKALPKSRKSAELDLIFLGFVGIADPAREGLSNVIKTTKRAGIRTIMITGDNPKTATSVAKHIGLLQEGDRVVIGKEIAVMSDEELSKNLSSIRIYARTTPEDKHRIVRLLQESGEVVSVTGDGINDALALKQADTGVAMGITGTDVAKEVADMVITDDNYASIVKAVREGRIIFENIVKSITYLVSCNFGELLTILGAMLASWAVSAYTGITILFDTPLLTVHILWINLVTDGLPALSLAFDPGASTIMHKQASGRDKRLINKDTLPFIIYVGFGTAIITLAVFFLGLKYGSIESARALSFTTLVLLQLAVVFLVRKKQKLMSNKILIGSVVISVLLQFIVITIPPFSDIFVK